MKFLIFISILNIESVFLQDLNPKRTPKRLVSNSYRTDWPSIRDRFTKNFEKRNDFMSQWMQQSFKRPFFNPIRDLTEDMDSPEFDPSVVMVDKGVESHDNSESFPGLEFPFGVNFQNPKFWSFGSNKPWWKGPNVCIERRVIEGNDVENTTKNSGLEVEDSFSFEKFVSNSQTFQHSISLQSTHCTQSDTSYTCISKIIRGRENKTTIIKHQCCHGYKRLANNYCTQVDLKDLIQTMKDLKSNRMLRMIERIGFSQNLLAQNLTILSVTDDSLIEYEDDNNKVENEIETGGQVMPSPVRRRRQSENALKEILSMHLIPGLLKTGDLDDEQLIETMSGNNKFIRINIYNNPKRVITANCAPIISANNYAKNGIVHIIDRVMQSPNKTIADIIENDQRFTILKNLLGKTDLINRLRDERQPITLFAPTNDAFLKLEELYLERLLKGQSCVEPFLLNHIINSTLCLTAIQDFASVKNSLNVFVPIRRFDEKLEIDGIPIIQTDLLGTNGVIHVINGVLLSERSQPISRFLERHRMTQYLNLIKDSGLLNDWDALQNVSFFIPSTDSLQTLSEKKLEEIKNNSKEMIEFNVIRPKSNAFDWNSDQMLTTISGNQIRINTFGDILGFGVRPVKTAQCAKIVAQKEICGANIQITDRFISPTKGNLIQILESNEKFSILRKIIKNSGLEEELRTGVYTLLAVTDQTLQNQLSQNQINLLIHNNSESEKFIKNNLFAEIMCCSGVNNSPLFLSSQQIRNINGSLITAHKSITGRVRFGNSRVTECDLMANNGVIHVINQVLENESPFITSLPFSFEFII